MYWTAKTHYLIDRIISVEWLAVLCVAPAEIIIYGNNIGKKIMHLYRTMPIFGHIYPKCFYLHCGYANHSSLRQFICNWRFSGAAFSDNTNNHIMTPRKFQIMYHIAPLWFSSLWPPLPNWSVRLSLKHYTQNSLYNPAIYKIGAQRPARAGRRALFASPFLSIVNSGIEILYSINKDDIYSTAWYNNFGKRIRRLLY